MGDHEEGGTSGVLSLKLLWIVLLALRGDAAGEGIESRKPRLADPHTRQVQAAPGSDLAVLVDAAQPGTTLLLADGLYPISRPLVFRRPDVWLRSASGRRDKVVLDGQRRKPLAREHCVNEIVSVAASDVCIAGLSICHARDHGIHVAPGRDGPLRNVRLHDLHVFDCGQQLIKANSNGGDPLFWPDACILEHSLVEFRDTSIMQDQGTHFYTGGLDVHGGWNWIVRDNVFRNIQREGKLMEHAVHLWNKYRDTIVERNQFIDCYRAIGFGMKREGGAPERAYPDRAGDRPYADHIGGMIRNNVIFNRRGIRLESGIELMNVVDVKVYHNTVVSQDKPFSCIEYRWPGTRVTIANNIVSHAILARDGATGDLRSNLTGAPPRLFVDHAAGDLHLAASAVEAIDRAAPLPEGAVPDDIDGDRRDRRPDLGADEYR